MTKKFFGIEWQRREEEPALNQTDSESDLGTDFKVRSSRYGNGLNPVTVRFNFTELGLVKCYMDAHGPESDTHQHEPPEDLNDSRTGSNSYSGIFGNIPEYLISQPYQGLL